MTAAADILRHIAQGGIASATNRAEVIADAADQLADLDVDRAQLDKLAADARCPRDVLAELVDALDTRTPKKAAPKKAAAPRKTPAKKAAPKKAAAKGKG